MIDLATASGSFGRYLVVNGDATISGKLETAELLTRKLSLIADTAATESSRAASFGESILPSGQTQLVVTSTSITQNSLIFITPTSPTEKTLYVMDKKKEEFTVGISSPAATEIKFNWWVIN